MTNLYNLVEISFFFLLLYDSEPGVLLSAVVNKDELMWKKKCIYSMNILLSNTVGFAAWEHKDQVLSQ